MTDDGPSVVEECLRFDCAGEALVGIVSRPQRASQVGLVIVVGGPQYRVGSHRQFVLLARYLAERGHAVLRFDYRGMGDSSGALRSFVDVSDDIDAAIGALRRAVPAVQQVALWGLCDGAAAALLYLDERPEQPLAGLCLLNPWVHSAQTQAAAHVKHHYAKRLTEWAFWQRMLRGQVGLGGLGELAGSMRTLLSGRLRRSSVSRPLEFQQRMARAWHIARCELLLVLSGQDLTAKEFIEALATDPAWRGALRHSRLQRIDLGTADHTFSDAAASSAVAQATATWLDRLVAGRDQEPARP